MTKEEKKEYYKQYYLKNREKILEQHKQWQINNEYDKNRYLKNKEKILEQVKQYYQENKEKIQLYKNEWYNKNKEKELERCRQYRKTPIGRAKNLKRCYEFEDKKYNRGECTLTADWIINNIFTSKCRYCQNDDWTELGCDRINNDLPHTPDNVVPCCEECNKKRGKKSFEEFCDEMINKA